MSEIWFQYQNFAEGTSKVILKKLKCNIGLQVLESIFVNILKDHKQGCCVEKTVFSSIQGIDFANS